MDGQDYHYPAFAWKPKPHLVAGWMHIIAPGADASLNIPDPRTLLSVLSPSAGFVTDGYTTGNGLGLGLSGAKRLCNEFAIKSTPGSGTIVTLARWR